MDELLVEKYRPKEFSDVIGLNPEISKLVESGNIPHMLFYGSQGTGKTTVAKIIAKKMGADLLMINASDERGIDVIRDKIKPFAKKMSNNPKIVFLDESDYTTSDFQTALRNFMETYSGNTRFICTCNYKNKIIPPLQSRLTPHFEFCKYKPEDIIKRLKYITEQENINVEDGVLELIVKKYKDDIRSMIGFLDGNRNKEMILKTDISNEERVIHILSKCKANEWESLRLELLKENIDYPGLINEMDEFVFNMSETSVVIKIKMNNLFAKYDDLLYRSFNKELCFAALLGEMCVMMR